MMAVALFYSYAHEDEDFQQQLEKSLALLQEIITEDASDATYRSFSLLWG